MIGLFEELVKNGFDINFESHSNALLQVDFPEVASDIEEVLGNFSIDVSELVGGGGGESSITQRLRRAFESKGWQKSVIEVSKTINGVITESSTHEVDHIKEYEKGVVALELEWNNKDPFYDRDLENYKRLHADNAISLGIIITRGQSLQKSMLNLVQEYGLRHGFNSFQDLEDNGIELTRRQTKNIRDTASRNSTPFHEAWASNFVRDKFGQATTHWNKLEDRIARGVGNPCPFVGIGIPVDLINQD